MISSIDRVQEVMLLGESIMVWVGVVTFAYVSFKVVQWATREPKPLGNSRVINKKKNLGSRDFTKHVID